MKEFKQIRISIKNRGYDSDRGTGRRGAKEKCGLK